MGWDSSHETLKVTSIVYKRTLRAVTINAGDLSYLSHNVTVNFLFKASIFPIKGKKNNQWSVSDADPEIPVYLVSDIIRLPSGWDFSVCIRDRA